VTERQDDEEEGDERERQVDEALATHATAKIIGGT